MRKIRTRATYANVVATLALILAIGGGSAYALEGRNTVFSDDIAPNEVKAADAKEESFKTPRILESQPSEQSTEVGQMILAVADCPRGYSVTGGGWSDNSSNTSVDIKHSIPYTHQTNYSSWLVQGVATGTGQTVTAHAICERGTTLPQ